MFKIGVVNIDTSHPLAFSDILRKENRGRYSAIFNDGFRGDDEIESFIKNHGLDKRFMSINDMADYADIGFIQGCDWDTHVKYAVPFIEKGKPVFIDKPIVGNIKDCKKIKELADNGAVILGSSSVRYANEIRDFLAIDENTRGKTVNVFGSVGVDEFNYGIHIVEGICGLIPEKPVSVCYMGSGRIDEKICETYYVKFENGVTAIYNSFIGTWQPFEFVIMTTKTTYQFRIDTSTIYKSLLDRICDYMETGINNMASANQLIDPVMILLAGRRSRETKGGEVKLSDIPDDDPGFDGALLCKNYAAASSKIYLK